jgi:predicted esterase
MDHQPIAIGPEPGAAAAVAIFVHGRARPPGEMRDLALAVGLPDVHFFMPAAPGATWYPESFLAETENNEPALTRSLDTYAGLIADFLGAGIPAERIVLAGFSQGACLTAQTLVRHPRRYGGALIFTGGLIGPPGTVWHPQPDLRGTPVYLSGSHVDEWVPVHRVEATGRILGESGARVELKIFDDRPHVVCTEEIAAARRLLSNVIAAVRPPGKRAARA